MKPLRWSQLQRATQEAARARLRGVAPDCTRVVQSGARRRGGRKANAAGDSLEAQIDAAAARGDCPIALSPLPKCGARFVGRGKAKAEPIDCDRHGCVCGSGRAVFMDAKAVGTEVASMRIRDPKIVKPHQAKFLRRMAAAGAVAGLLVRCERMGDYRWLDGLHLDGGGAVGWEDPRWVVLGPTSRPLSLARLVSPCHPQGDKVNSGGAEGGGG